MRNTSETTWETVRIGIAPFYPSVSPCVLERDVNSCKIQRKIQGGVGIELEVLIIVLNLLKLRPKFVLSPDPLCGYVEKVNDSSYKATSLFNMLLKDEIDMTGNTCAMTNERLLFANISYPVYYSRQVFVLKKPVAAYDFDIWAPLSLHAWISCAALFFVVQGFIIGLKQLRKKCRRWKFAATKFNVRIEFFSDSATGFFCAIYSSFVLVSLMFPKAKLIPFKSGSGLSFLVQKGQYRLASPYKPAELPVGSNETQERFKVAVT